MCYCPHMQVKLCLRKCPLKMVITTLQKLYWSILLTPTHESSHFSNNRCYLFLSFWPILLYLYFLEYKWDSIFSDVQLIIYIFFLHTLSKYSFPHMLQFFFISILFMVTFTIMQLNLRIFFPSWVLTLWYTYSSPTTIAKWYFPIVWCGFIFHIKYWNLRLIWENKSVMGEINIYPKYNFTLTPFD